MSKFQTTFTNIDKEFHEIVGNKDLLHQVTEKYLDKVIDTITIGIALSAHRSKKAKFLDLEKDLPSREESSRCFDIFGQYSFKKKYECLCRNCDKIVVATGFAPHLEVCMGMGKSRLRSASRRIANNSAERENSSYVSIGSDDEDDLYWNSADKRKKKKDRNGNKKLKGTPKKSNDLEPVESINIDVEGETDDILSLKDLLQDFSRSSSPADSVSSSGSIKKREKSKSKKRKDRSSPNSSMNFN